jgi:putative FmdB family regulatory protein
MPTYDYQCKKCGNEFEVFHSMSSEPVKICPKCGGEVKKLIGAGAGAIFKGSGFYHTDYKNAPAKSKKPETKAPAPAKPESKDPSSPAKPESKPGPSAKSE